jgi:DNA-binding NtrC family response regulator
MLVLENGKLISADEVRKHLKGYQQPVSDRNLPVYANKTVAQAERELIYRALVDLKSSIMELRDIVLQGATAHEQTQDVAVNRSNGNGVMTLDEMERRMIVTALDRHKGNRRLAAKELNISERTLYRKIKEFGLQG